MKLPQDRSHKPIITVYNYEQIDGQYVKNTDARALSIGWATYDNSQMSLKVWRHTGKQWSRQSEDIPIHRCLDLSILFLAALKKDKDLPYPTCSLPLTIDNESEFAEIRKFYEDPTNKKHINARLLELRDLLNEWYKREGV